MSEVATVVTKNKILCIATFTPGIGINEELQTIKDLMRGGGSGFDVDIEYVTSAGDISELIQNTRPRPEIIHICAEGNSDGIIEIPNPDNKKIDRLKSEELAEFFKNAEDVKYVVLNFCYSGQAAQLIYLSVQCVIGIDNVNVIERTAAVEFSKAFYSSLEGKPLNQIGVDQAFSKAQAAAFPRTGDRDRYIKLVQKKSQPEIQVIEPAEGSTVPYECKCRGAFKNLDEGASMWAYVNATIEGRFYLVLISNYPPRSTDGEWQVPLYIGVREGDNNDYRIGFLMVDVENTSKLKEDYHKAIKEFGYFALDSLPTNGTQVFGDRTVTRQ